MAHPRTLALDVGDRRIGLAITDPLGLIAQPLFTLHRTTPRADLKSIARFLRQHKVEIVVVGHPLHADGSRSPQAAKAEAFAASLREAHPTLTHYLLDERLTTREAHALLDGSGGSSSGRAPNRAQRLHRKDRIDQVAATLLLEAFLSLHAGPTLLPDPDSALDSLATRDLGALRLVSETWDPSLASETWDPSLASETWDPASDPDPDPDPDTHPVPSLSRDPKR